MIPSDLNKMKNESIKFVYYMIIVVVEVFIYSFKVMNNLLLIISKFNEVYLVGYLERR
jgi:hypothetical protein